jgi:hypothetical protein
MNETGGYLMKKLIYKKHRTSRSEDHVIANHHARTGAVIPVQESLAFTGTGEEGSPPPAPPQFTQRRLSGVTFLGEATRPAKPIVVDHPNC